MHEVTMSDLRDALNACQRRQMEVLRERDEAREECGFEKGMRRSIRRELDNFIKLKMEGDSKIYRLQEELNAVSSTLTTVRRERDAAHHLLRGIMAQYPRLSPATVRHINSLTALESEGDNADAQDDVGGLGYDD